MQKLGCRRASKYAMSTLRLESKTKFLSDATAIGQIIFFFQCGNCTHFQYQDFSLFSFQSFSVLGYVRTTFKFEFLPSPSFNEQRDQTDMQACTQVTQACTEHHAPIMHREESEPLAAILNLTVKTACHGKFHLTPLNASTACPKVTKLRKNRILSL